MEKHLQTLCKAWRFHYIVTSKQLLILDNAHNVLLFQELWFLDIDTFLFTKQYCKFFDIWEKLAL